MRLTWIVLFWLIPFMSKAQRNIVMLIADDLGTDYFGFYTNHQDTVDVPNIRSLLRQGVKFSQASANPVCSSTRSGLLTGRYSFRTGVGGIVGGTGGSNPLDTSEITIPKLLKKYNPNISTANIGKWHLHQPMPASNLLNPNKMGYDHFEGPFIGQLTGYTNWTKYTNGVSSNVTNYATTENVNNALEWLKKQGSKPCFLWLAFNAPHAPYHLPPANLHSYNGLSGTNQDIAKNPKLYFKAMLQALDHEIGRFCDSLKRLNRFDSTDFVFMGDNGNSTLTAQIANKDRAKGTIYNYGTQVPLIISGPSVVKGGRTSDALINTVDIFATVLDLFHINSWSTQIPANKPVDSKSILPILQNTATEIRPWAFSEIFKITTDSNDGKTMRNLNFKLLKFDQGNEAFYNLKSDSLELNNLLLNTLTTDEQLNYNYLCTEMSKLVNKHSFCNNALSVAIPSQNTYGVYPNPFHSFITINPVSVNNFYVLTNTFGQIVFEGADIQKHDFSNLPKGLYHLRTNHNPSISIQLLKN